MNMVKRAFLLLMVAFPVAGNATILYEFTAESSFIGFGNLEIEAGGFAFETSDFITSDIFLEPVDLLSCSIQLVSGSGECVKQDLLFDFIPEYETVAFGFETNQPFVGSSIFYYYFEEGAFGAAGEHVSLLGSDIQVGRLKVSEVPEPGTPGLLLLGLFVLARRCRATV